MMMVHCRFFEAWLEYGSKNGFSENSILDDFVENMPHEVDEFVEDPYHNLDFYSFLKEDLEDDFKKIKLDSNFAKKIETIMKKWYKNLPNAYEDEKLERKPNSEQLLKDNIKFMIKKVEDFKILARRAVLAYMDGKGPE